MITVRGSSIVRASLEEVFELVKDPKRWAALFQEVKGVAHLEEDRSLGSSVAKFTVNEGKEEYEVTQIARMPGIILRKVKGRGMSTETTYHLSRSDEGTRVEFKTEMSLSGIYRLLNPMAEWYLSRRLAENGYGSSWA